jgi:nitroreductase
MIRELIRACRCHRRFDASRVIRHEELLSWVDMGRLTASSMNKQPLRYLLSWQAERNALLFSHLRWAACLEDWDGPAEQERPGAYILVLADPGTSPHYAVDAGMATQNIRLAAMADGIASCVLMPVDTDSLKAELGVPEEWEVVHIIALGQPGEKVVLEESAHDLRYYRDRHGVHHVPKRPLEQVVFEPEEPGG